MSCQNSRDMENNGFLAGRADNFTQRYSRSRIAIEQAMILIANAESSHGAEVMCLRSF